MDKNRIVQTFKLTQVQKEAALWNQGALLVLAGPGAGKTRVSTARITSLIADSQDDNFRILALTFTNKAASEMRERVRDILPGLDYRTFLGTFHSFCAEVLRNHGSSIGVKPDFAIYSDSQDLQEILNDVRQKLEHEQEIGEIGVANLLPIIQFLQSNLIAPGESTGTYISSEGLRQGVEKIYKEYDSQMQKLNALDFNMIILKTNQLFKKYPFVAKHYRTLYPYICIDEFQDTNYAQYQLLLNLTAGSHQEIFAVADDDQIIFQWNGANFQRIEDFRRDFQAVTIQLPDNFRCPAEVVDLANQLISHNLSRTAGKKPLVSHNVSDNTASVRCLSFQTVDDEINWIASDILNSRHKGMSVSVLARNRKLLQRCYQGLTAHGVSAVMYRRKAEFESPPFVWLHNVLRLANKRNDRRYLFRVVQAAGRFLTNSPDLDEIVAWSEATDGDLLKGYIKHLDTKDITNDVSQALTITLAERNDHDRFIASIMSWFNTTFNKQDDEAQYEWFPDFNIEQEAWTHITVDILSRHDRDTLTLSVFLQEMDLAAKDTEPNPDQVQCLTIHSSKGKEYDHVYLLGMAEDELPSFQSIKKGAASMEMEEERRNCYVAVTRTKKLLTLTYASFYWGWPKSPSRFLREMGLIK